VDATQEMLTLGVCNVAGSLVSAMPTCGAFTRSAVSNSSGVRTPLAGLFSGKLKNIFCFKAQNDDLIKTNYNCEFPKSLSLF